MSFNQVPTALATDSGRVLRSPYAQRYRARVEVRWLLWDDYNIEHIATHGVKPAEVEQVVFGTGMKGPFEENHNRPGRLLFFGFSGPTPNRRRLVAVTDRPTPNGEAYVVSARPATDRERRKYMEE